tara:strand:- start:1649 stop:2524 length:876 start_codon:yes stop_codon:yes gene_type:complete
MSIYLGTFGNVELKRQFNDSQIDGTVTVSDVDVNRKRFSFDFDPGLLVTGDQVRISNKEDSPLSFISGYSGRAVRKFINVDELNGIRLYNSFADAINGGTTNATTLATPSASIEIKVIIQSSTFRILSQVRSYELNTQRETVDTTSLSDNFRSQISGLMSGSGRVTCFWEYTGDTEKELPQYLLQLLLRTKVGSRFAGQFYIKTRGETPTNDPLAANHSIWHEVEGFLTSCAVQFVADQAVEITADFVTTGPIELKVQLEPGSPNILQENSDGIVLDQDSSAKLVTESSGL